MPLRKIAPKSILFPSEFSAKNVTAMIAMTIARQTVLDVAIFNFLINRNEQIRWRLLEDVTGFAIL